MITPNQVYTKIEDALTTSPLSAYCTQSMERIPISLPCMYFREEHYRPERNITFTFNDEQLKSTVHIELYGVDLDSYIRAIETVMSDMYFIEESCNQIDNGDPDVERYVFRFSRMICGGDTL